MTLQLRGLGLRHPGSDGWALRAVDLDVAPGEVVAVVGPSGSGKTTLLRLVCGLLSPTEGTVALDGADQGAVPPERRPVAMVFQGFALFPHLVVRDNIAFGLRVRRVSRSDRSARVDAASSALGIGHLLERYPSELSGGERQRVALARALVRDPRVFCLDEPLSALDPLLRTGARRELAPLLSAEGRCALLVTHDQAEAVLLGDRVAVLRDGRLEQVGTPAELYARPATPFVASFLGTPPMTVVPGQGGVAGPVRSADTSLGECLLGVRPEHVRLAPAPVGEAEAGTVVGVDDLGHERHVLVAVAGVELLARTVERPVVGTRVTVTVDPGDVHRWEPEL